MKPFLWKIYFSSIGSLVNIFFSPIVYFFQLLFFLFTPLYIQQKNYFRNPANQGIICICSFRFFSPIPFQTSSSWRIDIGRKIISCTIVGGESVKYVPRNKGKNRYYINFMAGDWRSNITMGFTFLHILSRSIKFKFRSRGYKTNWSLTLEEDKLNFCEINKNLSWSNFVYGWTDRIPYLHRKIQILDQI